MARSLGEDLSPWTTEVVVLLSVRTLPGLDCEWNPCQQVQYIPSAADNNVLREQTSFFQQRLEKFHPNCAGPEAVINCF